MEKINTSQFYECKIVNILNHELDLTFASTIKLKFDGLRTK